MTDDSRFVGMPTADQQQLADAAGRHRIRTDLGSTLFVEAGAGSGKTAALVDRVLALIDSGEVELRSIAAITFTEKAGDELRDRIRQALTERRDTADPEDLPRYQGALDQLDSAAIGTLHSFAQRLLSEHPIEAGLPPRVEVLDEVSSDVAFATRWATFQDELLADSTLERTLLLLFAAGARPEGLRLLAQAFEANWDLVESHVPEHVPDVPAPRALLGEVMSTVNGLCAEPCSNPDDKLLARLVAIQGYVTALAAVDDDVAFIEALGGDGDPRPPGFAAGNIGSSKAWADVKAMQDAVAEVGAALAAIRDQVGSACAERIGSEIRRFTLASANERRRAGQLQFQDLLVLARVLLSDPLHGPAVRRRLHGRYARLLVDELQDTDPLQMEIAVRIAAADPDSDEAGSAPWEQVVVEPGHLFCVGDPKQSIYRFRRADIAMFLRARDRFGVVGHGLVELTSNFRTVSPVVQWVNATFDRLMGEGDDVELPVPSQPAYLPLDPVRGGPPAGPPISVLGRHPHPLRTSADELRQAEAADVAAAITAIRQEGWLVDEGGEWRPTELGDITILLPARTSLPYLEDALSQAHIAYRAESSSLVYSTRAIRDLLMVVRAVDDPTNRLHIFSALRTPLLACGDDDLFRFRVERRGHWSYLADQPDSVPPDDPVRLGLDFLRGLYDVRHWIAPSELLDRVVRERRVLELGFAEGRARDVWRRVRFVIDQARAWTEATGGNLREYLAWVEYQTSEGARVAEAILPETDDDAVRIMTIHAAKGLEFPVVILSGTSTKPMTRRASVEVVFPPTGGVGYKVGRDLKTEIFEEFAPIDEQMGLHERIRLLYVASTRARDHLVLSLHRAERKEPPKATARTNAELLVDGIGALLDGLPDGPVPSTSTQVEPVAARVPDPPRDLGSWRSDRARTFERATRRSAVSATALTEEGTADVEAEPAEGLQKRPRDLDLPPWLKGRYGTAVGRAVHGVLQGIDLSSGADLEHLVRSQCEAEAVVDRERDVEGLVTAALGSPSVQAAAHSEHWRELYFCIPLGDRLLEGYIDLLYRGPAGLVVADYKTASTSALDVLQGRVEGYRNQGAAYALAVAQATGEPVVGVVFIFLTPTGAVEIELPNLESSIESVRAAVEGGHEVETA